MYRPSKANITLSPQPQPYTRYIKNVELFELYLFDHGTVPDSILKKIVILISVFFYHEKIQFSVKNGPGLSS